MITSLRAIHLYFLNTFSVLLVSVSAFGQTVISNTSAVTQNFDGMAATTTLPTNWRMAASTASPTWAAAATSVTQQASSGSPATGGTYNFGSSASERAVGAMTSGGFASPNNLLGFFQNTNASNLTSLTISYDAERYRINSAAASVQFFYSLNGNTWIAITAGDIAAASFPTGAIAYNFTTGTVVNRTGISITGLNIATNGNFYLRWNVNTTGANSQGIAIDNVSVTAAFAVATPTIALSSPSQTGASNINQSTSNNILSNFQAAVTTANATLNSLAFTTTGTYNAADLTGNFSLFYSTSNTFGSASSIGTVAVGTAGTRTFTSLTQAISSGATGYFWIVANSSGTSGGNRTLTVSADPTLTFASGTPTGTIAIGGIKTFVDPTTPTLTAGTLTAFGSQCVNGMYGPNSFTITGTALTTANVTVSAFSGYEFSTTSAGTYTSSLSLTQSGGAYSQTIFVRFIPTSAIAYNGNIVIGGGGASNINVATSGTGINGTVAVTTVAANAITTTTASSGGNTISTSCGTITAKGVVWGIAANPTIPSANSTNDGTGTANFTSSISTPVLTPGTVYNYRAYATNSNGITSYGTNLTFTTLKLEPSNFPTSFACGTTTINSIPLSFTAATGSVLPDGYLLKWSATSYAAITDPVDGTAETNGTGVQNVTASPYTFTSLTSGTTYFFKIWSFTNSGNSIDYKLVGEPQTSCATLTAPWEDFETGSNINAYGGSGTFTAGNWILTDGLATTGDASDFKNGARSVRIRSTGNLAMNFNLTSGLGTVTLLHGMYGTDANGTWRLEASTDNGSTWTAFVSSTYTATSSTFSSQTITVNLTGTVRFRIVKLSILSTSNRLNIDDIYVTPFAGCSPPSSQANTFTSSAITVNTATTGWTRGNGNNVLVVARAGGAVNADPVSGTTYSANAAFGSGSQIGTGNFVVYNGSGDFVNLTALNSNITYHFAVYEYLITGTCYNLSELTGNLATLAPTITLSSSNPAVAAANINQGTINNVIYRFDLASAGNATLTGVTINTAGSYAASNVSNFKCWYSSDVIFNSATDALLSTKTASLGVGLHAFPFFTNQAINDAASGYFFITTDLPCLSTVGNTISVNAITTLDLIFSSGSKTGSASAGGTQTIAISTPNNVTAQTTTNCLNQGTTVNWTLPAGCFDATTGIFVFAKAGSFSSATPVGNGGSYAANAIFASGTSFDGGFCVYKGSGNTVNVTALTNEINYTYKIFTRNGTNWTSGVVTNCTPLISYCTAASTNVFNEFIQGVIFNTISNTSLATSYTDFTATPTTVEKGVTYPLTIYNGDYFATDVVKIWADWNGNGDFTDAGENIITTTSGDPAPYFLNVAVPVTSITGPVRMRIRLYDSAVGIQNTTPCGTHEYGEVEDYLMNVIVPCAPTHTFTSFAPNTGPVGTYVTLIGTGFTVASTVLFNDIVSTNVQFIDATKLIAVLPTGASTGKLRVSEASCFVNSSSNFTLISASGSCVSSASYSDLIISEVYDSQNNNIAYVELYNPTLSAINLATSNYVLKIDNNTGPTPLTIDRTITLTGSISAGGTFLINFGTSANTCNKTWNLTAGGPGINASDNILLAKNSVDVDRVNAPSNDGFSISRNPTALGPTPTFNATDWTISNTESCTNLGIAPVTTFPNPILNISNTTACNINLSLAVTEGNPTPSNDVTYKWYYNDGIATGWTEVTSSIPSGYIISGQTSINLQISNNSNFVTSLNGFQFYNEGTESSTCRNVSAASKFEFNTRPIYRTISTATGNWTTISNWEMANSTAGPWVTACTFPISANSSEVIIQAGSNVVFNIDNSIDKLTIESGATLQQDINSQLTILESNVGADFILNGTFIYRSNSSNSLIFEDPAGPPRATWLMGNAATLIKTNTAGVADFRDYYDGGIATIPATASWIYRYDGTGSVAVVSASSGAPMFYPNLTFESVSGNHDFIAFTEIFTGRLDIITVKGDFTIGGNANNVRVFNNNFNTTPFQILGDLYIATGSTLTNDGYAAINANYDVQWREGSGFELKGDALVEGTLDVTHFAPNTASSIARVTPGEEGLILSKTSSQQDIIGSAAELLICNNLRVNTTTTALLDIDLHVYNKLIMIQGNVDAGSGLLTLGTSPTSVGTLEYTDGSIFGSFKRWFAASTNTGSSTGLFPVASGLWEKFVTVEFTVAPASGGNLTAIYNTNNMALSGVPSTSIITPAEGSCGSSFIVASLSSEGYWDMEDNGTLTTGSYNITFDAEGFTTINNLCQLTALKRVGAGNWLQSGTHKAPTGTLLRPIVKREAATGWSNWGFGGGVNNPLPIELLSFTATENKDLVDLSWTTASEINNDFFTIERSLDAVNFEAILKQAGAGNSNYTRNYVDVDTKPFIGTSYYRLKQTDFNGEFSYSDIVPVNYKSDYLYLLYAGSINNSTNLTVVFNRNVEDVKVRCFDLSGRVVYSTEIEPDAAQFELNLDILSTGIYLLEMTTEKEKITTKLIR